MQGQSGPRSIFRPGLIWIWIFALALLAHGPGLGGALTLDDRMALSLHPVVQGEAPWWEAFTREWFGRPLGETWSSSYRPLTTLSFAIVQGLGGGSFAQHLLNWILYAALCLSLFRVARGELGDRAAGLLALAFVVLPPHVENVASLVGRADTMAALLGLWAFERLDGVDADAGRGPRRLRVALGCAAYFAAMLCKETVALLPGLLIWRAALAWRHDEDRARVRAKLWAALAVSLVGVVYIVSRQAVLPVALPSEFNGADNLLRELGFFERALGGLEVWGHYISMSARGAPLCADHTWGALVPASTLGEALRRPLWWLGVGALVVALVDALAAWRGRSPGWFAGAAAMALLIGHFLIPLSVILAERLVLWPSIFVLWGLVDAGRRWIAPRIARPQLLPALLGLACALWTLQSAQRSMDWADDLSLFRSSARACPAAMHNRVNLADAEAKAGHRREALWHFAVSAALRPQYPAAPELPVFALEAELDGLFDDGLDEASWARLLPALPAQLGVDDAATFWRSLATFAARQGYPEVAQLAAQLADFAATGGRRP